MMKDPEPLAVPGPAIQPLGAVSQLIDRSREVLTQMIFERDNGEHGHTAQPSPEVWALVQEGVRHALDAIIAMLDHRRSITAEDVLIVLDVNFADGNSASAAEAVRRIDLTMDVVIEFASQHLPADVVQAAGLRLRNAAAIARMIVAGEVLRRSNEGKQPR